VRGAQCAQRTRRHAAGHRLPAACRIRPRPAGNAFREEVRGWLARTGAGERKRTIDARPFHDREFDADFALDLGQDRLARPGLAARVRRPGAHAAWSSSPSSR
jgi:hypothetical protein